MSTTTESPGDGHADGVPIREDVDCSEHFYVPRIECLPPESSTTTVPVTSTTLAETGIDPLGPALVGLTFIVFGLLSLVGAAYSRVNRWWYVVRHFPCVGWYGHLTAHWEPTAEMAGAFYLATSSGSPSPEGDVR